jgi:hypothetical protein
MKTAYSYIVLAKGLPVCLTVMAPGCPTIALAGEASGDPPASAGTATEVVWTMKGRSHTLMVRTESDEVIVVFGHGLPEFGSDK